MFSPITHSSSYLKFSGSDQNSPNVVKKSNNDSELSYHHHSLDESSDLSYHHSLDEAISSPKAKTSPDPEYCDRLLANHFTFNPTKPIPYAQISRESGVKRPEKRLQRLQKIIAEVRAIQRRQVAELPGGAQIIETYLTDLPSVVPHRTKRAVTSPAADGEEENDTKISRKPNDSKSTGQIRPRKKLKPLPQASLEDSDTDVATSSQLKAKNRQHLRQRNELKAATREALQYIQKHPHIISLLRDSVVTLDPEDRAIASVSEGFKAATKEHWQKSVNFSALQKEIQTYSGGDSAKERAFLSACGTWVKKDFLSSPDNLSEEQAQHYTRYITKIFRPKTFISGYSSPGSNSSVENSPSETGIRQSNTANSNKSLVKIPLKTQALRDAAAQFDSPSSAKSNAFKRLKL